MNLAVSISQRHTRRRSWRARRQAVATHARGFERRCFFDQNGNPLAEQLNLTQNGAASLIDSQSASYDQSDRKLSSTDAGGNVTAYQGARGRVLTRQFLAAPRDARHNAPNNAVNLWLLCYLRR